MDIDALLDEEEARRRAEPCRKHRVCTEFSDLARSVIVKARARGWPIVRIARLLEEQFGHTSCSDAVASYLERHGDG